MATSPNFSWPEPDNTDLVKNGALAIRTAINAIDTSMVDLKGGTTGQVLAKATNTDMDFSWVAQDDSNAIQNAIVDAKGDIIAATANDTPARLAVGANDTVLTADSTAATGLKWATPSAGGMTLLSTTTLSGTTTGSISSINQTYKNLIIYFSNTTSTTSYTYRWQPNGNDNASAIFRNTTLGTTISTNMQVNGSNFLWDNSYGFLNNSTANQGTLIIYDYASTTNLKSYSLTMYGIRDSGSTVLTNNETGTINANNNAITSIGYVSNAAFNGGTIRIFGVK